jgi:O-antigen ligase
MTSKRRWGQRSVTFAPVVPAYQGALDGPTTKLRVVHKAGAVAQLGRLLLLSAKTAIAGPSHERRARVLFWLAVPQFYLLPFIGRDIALSTIATLIFLPTIFLAYKGDWRKRVESRLFLVLMGLLLVRIAALAWSPSPRAGLQSTVLLGQFVATLLLMLAAIRQDSHLLRQVQRVYWPWVAVEAALVAVFRMTPAVEELFLRHICGLFAGQNAISGLFGTNQSTVFDPVKSGGFFLNANVAAMFLGVNGLAAIGISSVTGARWVRRIGIAALLAVPLTGSKSATVLTLVLPALAYGINRTRQSGLPKFRRPKLVLGIAGLCSLILIFAAVESGFLAAVRDAFVGRTSIWGFGAQAFTENPILGLGYGGWEKGFSAYAAEHGIYRIFPPHNIFLAAWSKTGIAGLLLTIAFFALVLSLALRRGTGRVRSDTKLVIYAGAAIAWTLLQGFGENTDVFGEIHLIPILALLIAYLLRGEEVAHVAKHARSRNNPTPAVPPV